MLQSQFECIVNALEVYLADGISIFDSSLE